MRMKSGKHLKNEEFHSLSCSSKSIKLGIGRHVARMEEGRRPFNPLTGKPTGNKLLGRARHRSEDNIRMVAQPLSTVS